MLENPQHWTISKSDERNLMTTYWLGIDVGTGGSRAILLDSSGGQAAAVSVPHEEIVMEQPLWAEQRPENWADASFQAIRGALAAAGIRGDQVRGVGLSGLMHGLVILDRNHRVIRPALIWCDQRSQPQVDWINQRLGAAKVQREGHGESGADLDLPCQKLLWVRDHEPRRFESVRHVLLPKDYVRFRLTGELATEVSDASGTAMFDVVRRRWSFEIMDGLGLDRSILPRAYESVDVTGNISESAAALTGLAPGTPVAGGGGDQASERGGQWRSGAGCGLLHARNVGRHLRAHGTRSVRSRRTRAYLLSRGS